MIQFVGYMALATSLILTCIGLPSQIRVNYRRKSCDGLDRLMFSIVTCAYLIWAIYGFMKNDWFIVFANIPGVIFSLVVLYQMRLYKKRVNI